jgi:6-pyruvoyltetrahydropterin/6-carboxytetrahydropterin synthase
MGMFTLCVKDSFAAAHKLIGYEGKCEDLHGHNFSVEAFFSGEKLGDDGLLIDFKILKDYLKNVLDSLDHKYLNEIPFFIEKASSAEYIAIYIFGEVEKQMKGGEAILKEIRVWESDKAYAAYER